MKNFTFSFFHLFTCALSVSILYVPLANAKNSPSALPSALIDTIRNLSQFQFCAEPVPLSNFSVKERLEKELLIAAWDRPQVILWLKRANRYFPIITNELKRYGLPEDLKYIPIVESALRPHAGSSKGAIGFWQFRKETGIKYGLRIDSQLDERRNIYKSTRAGLAYLKSLYSQFNSWALAVAAYNMGEAGLQSEIMLQKTNDFYSLYLPIETQRYLFRILAAKQIMTLPEKFGFDLNATDLYPPYQIKMVRFRVKKKIPLHLVAQAAETHFKVIKDLNPDIRGYYLSKGAYGIIIPAKAFKNFLKNLAQLEKNWSSKTQHRIYTVKRGDNLSTIATKFNIPLPLLLIWNNINPRKIIHPGDRIVIYKNSK